MSESEIPAISAVHHFSVTVTDVEKSVAWYKRVFGMEEVPVRFPHHLREDTGYAIVLIEPRSGLAIAPHHNEDNKGEPFDETRTGLDHLGISVPNRSELEAWQSRLDALGIEHSGIRDMSEPFAFSTLVFRDPDNIQLEFILVGEG
jgi:catechol 2,3-dioxygenase-like lactoylglutathione lyase family enzyme